MESEMVAGFFGRVYYPRLTVLGESYGQVFKEVYSWKFFVYHIHFEDYHCPLSSLFFTL